MGAGAISNVSEDLSPVLELNPVDTVGKRLHDDPFHEGGALGHERPLYQSAGLTPWTGPQPAMKGGWRSEPPGPFP